MPFSNKNSSMFTVHREGGYSLYSDDKDDRCIILGVVIGDLVFLGVVQVKSFKKIKLVFVRV